MLEVNWNDSEDEISEEVLLYSGHEEKDNSHAWGVTLTLYKEARESLIRWKSH